MKQPIDLSSILAKGSHSFREANMAVLGQARPTEATATPPEAQKPVKSKGNGVSAAAKRVRQSAKGPNKLELAFKTDYVPEIHPELVGLKYNALTLEIANGVRYTPDWVGWLDGTLTAWEIKGPFAYAGSLEKLKMAARSWQEINFILAWRENGKFWNTQLILP